MGKSQDLPGYEDEGQIGHGGVSVEKPGTIIDGVEVADTGVPAMTQAIVEKVAPVAPVAPIRKGKVKKAKGIPTEAVKEGFTETGDPTDDANPKDKIGRRKPALHLIPPAALLHEAAAMMDGAFRARPGLPDGYGPYNWREKKVLATIYISAVSRHLLAWLDGEELADDSGVHHLGHARASLGILLDAMESGNLVDDRPKAGPAAQIITRLTAQ